MHVIGATFLPVPVAVDDPQYGDDYLLDGLLDDLAVAYSFGPPYGERLVTWTDLDRAGASEHDVRRAAMDNLYDGLGRVRIHGQPPALMLSFDGLESSVLLADEFWDSIERRVPGHLVIGVPARDVVIITGSESGAGLEKAQRAVDRVFFARGPHLLSRDLLVWRQRRWMVFRGVPPARPVHSRSPAPPARQPAPYARQGYPPRQSGPPRMRRASGPAR